MRALLHAACVLLPVLLVSGSLGAPFQRDEVPFDSLERRHFDAFGVQRVLGAPAVGLLVVRVQLLGDATDTDLGVANAWLMDNARVRLEPAIDGAPLYLTRGDLSATSGRATLGATLKTGMAVEAHDERLTGCILVHEMLHFLGLRHVDAENNIMHPQCKRDRLDGSGLTDEQRAHLDSIVLIEAATPRGVQTWAKRAS